MSTYDTRTWDDRWTESFSVTRYTYDFPGGGSARLIGTVGPQVYTSTPVFGSVSTVSSVRGKRQKGFSINKFELNRVEQHAMDSSVKLENVRKFRFWGEDYMEVEQLVGNLAWYRYSYDGVSWGAQLDNFSFDPAFLEQKAVLGAHGKACAPKFELGVNLGELRETFEMLRDPFSALRGLLTNRHIGVKDLANNWMEYRYGIMPLIYTIQDIIKAVRDRSATMADHLYSGRSQQKIVQCERVVDIPVNVLNLSFQACRYYTTTFRVGAICYYRYKRPPTLSYMLGVDLSALPAIAWELTKLSWLVDWWLGIGDFLKAHRYDSDVIFMGDCATHIREDKVLHTVMGQPTHFGVPFNPNAMTMVSTKTSIYRNPAPALANFPQLDLTWRSVKHTLDALSLSWQKLPLKH